MLCICLVCLLRRYGHSVRHARQHRSDRPACADDQHVPESERQHEAGTGPHPENAVYAVCSHCLREPDYLSAAVFDRKMVLPSECLWYQRTIMAGGHLTK